MQPIGVSGQGFEQGGATAAWPPKNKKHLAIG